MVKDHQTFAEERLSMPDAMYHPTSPAIAQRRSELAPHIHEAFGRAVFTDGAFRNRPSS
jgi:hypothetical protein